MVDRIYPTELQLNRVNSSDTEAPFLDLKLNDFNYRNKALTVKLLRQGYRYFKLFKAFSKFYRRYSALVEIYSVSPENTSATRYIGT